ncbi:MAG: hypothetical protein AMJ73_04430 [candidate division Zixibacteria bacterium SM1_73]|nr:MAG: hypothetical protein AMJ73_04430 [candidate division Zixibacteria bacterium SM1_73]
MRRQAVANIPSPPGGEGKAEGIKAMSMNTNDNKIFSKTQLMQFLIAFFFTALGIITAYYTTIAGIKLDLSKKAESTMVNQLDKRLSNIEILLNKNFLTKDEFHVFSEDLQKRLARIEYQLAVINSQ